VKLTEKYKSKNNTKNTKHCIYLKKNDILCEKTGKSENLLNFHIFFNSCGKLHHSGTISLGY
tara:strand:- start:53 stop:238 length:186 start_codon:yes stop_codon:yes gene_type:complete